MKKMKIVINCDYGGFSLSDLAIETYADRKGIKLKKEKTSFGGITLFTNIVTNEDFESRDIERNDPVLVKVVEELGSKSFGFAANLKIVEVPDDVDWEVVQYDGLEHIAEKHRTWS
jgi:hypothetical protein